MQPSAESMPPFYEEQVADNSSPSLPYPPSPPPYVGPPLCANINLPITQLGKVAPVWRPDSDTVTCMQCDVVFTFTRRRHHCRACGKVGAVNCSDTICSYYLCPMWALGPVRIWPSLFPGWKSLEVIRPGFSFLLSLYLINSFFVFLMKSCIFVLELIFSL